MCHPSRFFGFLTSCSFGTSTFILCHFIQCHFIVQEITRQKRSIAKKFSTKNEITSLKSEYTSEWIRKNEDFFSTFSLEYEPAYACEIIRLTDDLFSEVQSSKPCNFDSSLKAFIPKSPEDNSMINHEATATSPFADVNDRYSMTCRNQNSVTKYMITIPTVHIESDFKTTFYAFLVCNLYFERKRKKRGKHFWQ
ncbi:hypothetical protein Y032_0473g2094 [Ancylostoma ceylanicum]|uniref:Uncharacterized protein n=1 Tax=Ancylostoma ceylanicum TaxID=53326 RepID=A0A016WWN7_9BILA|nr:hypothetical protein Y032_0473g2094 [Ancylostoma ceylanicum]